MISQPIPKQQKYQRRTFYGFKRENIQEKFKSYSIPIINYRILPTGIAKPNCLRIKLECLLGRSVFNFGKPHPCFRYLIRKLIFYEAVNYNKRTDYRMIVGNQNSIGLNNPELEGEVKKMVEEIMTELQNMQNQGIYRFKKDMKREERLEMFAQKIKHYRQQLRQKLKGEATERKQSAQRLGREVDFIDSEEYVDELIDNVDRIQTLRQSQQIIKFQTFVQRNNEYFGATFNSKQQQRPLLKTTEVILDRPSSEMEPLLQNITEMIGLRSPQTSYKPESVILLKSIYQQLKRYQNQKNSTETRPVYEHLHPNHIIFDQIALNAKLSFIPLLLDLYGVKKKPISLQTRIAFCPTPTAFDYFRSLEQLDFVPEIKKKDQINNIPLVLDDPFFGNRALYDNEKQKLELASDIEEQKRQLQYTKGKILTGRFLLLSHYILNSVQYGFKPNLTSNHDKIINLHNHLASMKESLQNDMSKLSEFMGSQNALVAGKPFKFIMTELGDFMSIDNDDSVLQSNKHVLTRKYFQARNLIIKQFIRLLVNDKIFGRIFNIKKYILVNIAISIEIIEQAKKLVQVELRQRKQRKKLREYLDKTLIRLKAGKNHFGYLQTTQQKIGDYRNRDPQKDHQAKYAKEDEIGKKAIAYVDEVSKLMHFLQDRQDKLNQWEEREDLSTDQKEQYDEFLKQVDAAVNSNAEKVRGILNEFIFNELRLKYADGPHRVPEDETQKQWLNMYTNRLELLTLVYISFTEENFILYSTLVIPQFHIDISEKKLEMPKGSELPELLKIEEKSMKMVNQLIDSSKLLPRRMVYFATKTSNDEIRVYERIKQQ